MPKRRLKGLFLALAVLLIGFLILIGGAVFWYETNISPTKAGEEKVIVIQKGQSTEQTAAVLVKNGLIRDSLAFRIYLRINNIKPNIQAGTFKLKTGLTIDQVLAALAVGRLDKWVTIREGLRIEEIAALLKTSFPIKEADFINLATEGYMFPDTYLLPIDATASKAVGILQDNFNKRVDADIKAKIASKGLLLDQAVIIASIVERESRSGEERAIIAGILMKRWQESLRLEVDATIQYALGYQQQEKTWWKKILTDEDLQIDSPYNTRKFSGLPPGPICNPGLEVLKAVANPTKTDYYFYLHDRDGKVHYAKTLEEHNANASKYLGN